MPAGTIAQFTPVIYMFGFGILASVPALILSRLVSPRRRYNPVKFLPMECGQMPTGEGRSHFMMQYYAYILMFVVFDVMSIFLYTWATSLFLIPRVCNPSDYGIFRDNVCCNGLCPISGREERNLVIISLISVKYPNYKQIGVERQ